MARIALLTVGILAMAASCTQRSPSRTQFESVNIPYTISGVSKPFSKSYIRLSIDSMAGSLFFYIQCGFPQASAFPIDKASHDTLTETAFDLELKADGQPMAWDPGANKLHPAPHAATMVFSSDTIDLRNGTSTTSIPYYAFRHLKKGMHHLELTISQHRFRSGKTFEEAYDDSTFRHPSTRQVHHYAEQRMVSAKVQFRLHVPAIHETILYMNRIDLRNDSTYSPYGSDNTLWKSSLPDLYWEVLYPDNNRYAASAYETSTMDYTTPDTVNLYHYSTMDTVGFEVMDHDMLSSDDGMGYAYYSLRDIIKRKRLNTAFGNVKLFSIRADYKGVVNR